MRWQSVATVLALGATQAWAQPTAPVPGEPPAPTTPTEPGPAANVPVTIEGTPPASPTPTAPVVATPVPEPSVPEAAPPKRVEGEGFRFGSYGRAIAGSDLRGGKPQKILIVAHGPRIVEDSYLELEFSYGFVRPKADDGYIVLRPIITLALDGTLFHDTGEFEASRRAQHVPRRATVQGRLAVGRLAHVSR